MRTIIRNSYTPKTGDYCNKIVVDEDTSTQYIFDCDGVYTTYTSKQQEGAPMFYVDSKVASATNEAKSYADQKDQQILAEAKQYTDEHGGSGDVTKAYVDVQDTNVLNNAKAYADTKDASTLSSAKSYADTKDASTLSSAKDYADTQSTGALDSAKAYAVAQDTSILNSAKAYADEKDLTVAGEAASYTDGEIADLKTELEGEITGAMDGLAPVATSGAYSDLSGTPIVPVINLTTTDPGEGSALAANTFVGVYNG